MRNLAFYGYHGVLKEENILGQKFFIDIEIFCDLKRAGKTDDVADTVNYAEIYDKVKNIVTNKKFKLIEALAENIAQNILLEYKKVREVSVTIKKPEAPVNGIYDYFGVEIRRKRHG
ncbi:dihydroneopterin aldolase [Caminicella sporogenes DSM 14501]|uniref:7,8-dihydroneopterin aldolase n=2 Tax=Caminicella TaxID=166484 RepID=A0A1M6P202_9FIRM|nr:dihydroneopterin aldolase [Caminicella sporogenes DSM 14501]